MIITLRALLGLAVAHSLTAGMMSQSPQIPFSFVENKGQADAAVRYIGSGPDFRALFEDQGVRFQVGNAKANMRFAGGAKPRIAVSQALAAKANYLLGQDSRQWLSDLPLFSCLEYRGVWPGVEIRFKADVARTKAEYVVAPGTPVSAIRLRFDGKTTIQPDGSLVVATASGEFREDKPYLFQGDGSSRLEVKGGFTQFADGSVGFAAADYDATQPLVVDPTIVFSGYFGGVAQTNITGVAVNSYYNTIVTGWTLSSGLSTSNAAQIRSGGSIDAFVAGFSPAGGVMTFCTYLGGSGSDEATGIAVDASNNTYITGWTSSNNFPVANAIQSRLSGTRDAFVVKLNPAGNALIYSTYLGGSGVDTGNAIALDSANSVVIVGDTTSANLPVTAGALQRSLRGSQDVFVAKLNPSGTALMFLTYLGGSAVDHGAAIALDASASVFVGGSTYSTNFPVLNAAQQVPGGGQDAFFAKLTADGKAILFCTYLGGSGGSPGAPEEVNGIVVGPSGNVIGAGTTSSANFPVSAVAYQTVFGGGQTDGFIARFSGTSGALLKCSFLGGSLDDGINAISTDFFGNLLLTGYTSSPDFPTVNAVQSVNGGGLDAFVTKMSFTQILFSTYLGGAGSDSGNAIAVDSMTSVVIGGSVGSSNYPVRGSVGPWSGSMLSSFVTKLSPNFTLNLAAGSNFYFDVWHDTGYNGPNNVTLNTSSFGLSGDIPVVGDWDGTGSKRIGVFRNGSWLLDINGNGLFDAGDKTVVFGQAGDLPVVGDWDGTGRIKLGLFRQGAFILDLSGHLSGVATGVADASFNFGLSTDIPVVADWNHSGAAKVGVFRNGQWLVDYNGDRLFDGLDRTYSYGQAGDIPIVGDWDSSGVPSKIGVYRHGLWILNYGGANSMTGSGQWELYAGFGSAGYIPLVR